MSTLLRPLKAPAYSGFDVIGSFGIGSSGAVDTTDVKGKGFTVEKESGDGLYTITLTHPVRDVLFADGTVQASSVGALQVQVTGFSVSARTVSLQVKDATPAAANPASGNRVHFRIVCTFSQAD